MKISRKITYTASSTAIATVCILIARFLPLNFLPLMVAAVCFYIALQCGIVYGLLCMAASMLLTFFWGSVDLTILMTGFFFAPYSIIAFLIKKLSYKQVSQAAVRLILVIVLFNATLALIVFGFLGYAGEVLIGFNLAELINSTGYATVAVLGSIIAGGFDYMFVMAVGVLFRRLKIKD